MIKLAIVHRLPDGLGGQRL